MAQRVFSAVAVLGTLIAGCQTDGIVSRPRIARAPVTAFESVEIARQSDMSLAEPAEVDLVEKLIYHRTLYAQTLEHLQAFYLDHGYLDKANWAMAELEDARRVRAYHYLLDSEIPEIAVAANQPIVEADQLYADALETAQRAGHGVPALFNRGEMSEALRLFKQVVREYPTSDKIDDAAFYIGELYKEYFESSETLAVKWYEKAWTWDPATPHPARFQAAVVYDYRLHDRARAIELYGAAVAAESNRSNTAWALDRIKRLSEYGSSESRRTTPLAPSGFGQPEPTMDAPAQPWPE